MELNSKVAIAVSRSLSTAAALPRGARIKKWKDYLDWTDAHSDSRWIFRGLGDAEFPLVPGAGRTPKFDAAQERAVIELFRRHVPEHGLSTSLSSLDLLAIAQHHGAPTRLLDWTTNPLVAAFFAVTGEPGPRSVRLELPTGRASRTQIVARPDKRSVPARVVAVNVRSNQTLKSLDDPFAISEVKFFWPRAVATRITSQSGAFTVHPQPDQPWLTPLLTKNAVFDIPGEMRAFFQKRLYYLGVHDHGIMGGLDGVGARLNWQYHARTGLGAYSG